MDKRIYLDACFDLLHYGHANIVRQAKELGYTVVVGVHSDETIQRSKGPSVYDERERYELVRAIRWVDEVVEDAPFHCDIDLLDRLNCDVLGHGDDVSISAETGLDSNHIVKSHGRFVELKRTRGVSTTNLIDRMLNRGDEKRLGYNISVVTTSLLANFARREPKCSDGTVYIAGDFDLLHTGNVHILRQVREHGDHVVVGLHTDQDVLSYKGSLPIMTVEERALCLLATKYVDEVVLGTSVVIHEDLLDALKVDVVCRRTDEDLGEQDVYRDVHRRGIPVRDLTVIDRTSTESVIRRVEQNSNIMAERNAKKAELMERGKVQKMMTATG